MYQWLAVVRHGDYGQNRSLSPHGQRQIEELGAKLAERFAGKSIVLLSSPVTRAMETSEILARHFGEITIEEHAGLYSEGGSLSKAEARAAIELVERAGAECDVVVLSTHFEFIDEFPTAWGLSKNFIIPLKSSTPRGTARLINVSDGATEHIRP